MCGIRRRKRSLLRRVSSDSIRAGRAASSLTEGQSLQNSFRTNLSFLSAQNVSHLCANIEDRPEYLSVGITPFQAPIQPISTRMGQ